MADYKESTGNFWKPTAEGDILEGLYIQKEEKVGPNESNIYYIERLDNHEVVQLWGTTVLDMRMMPVKIGSQVRITYKGLAEKGGRGKNKPHLWKVEYKEADVDLVSAAKDEFDIPDN